MIIIITGASHVGKTNFAQRMLEKYKFPYLSIDHLKMGLIRSGNTDLTPLSDDKDLTEYLWPIVCEMIKTAIENNQNLIVEGCYIPFDWQKDFTSEYLENIKYYCLVMTEEYIKNNFENIKKFANIIENRMYDDITIESVIRDNNYYLTNAKLYNQNIVLIEEKYAVDIENTCQI
ncbi:MAG: adenylate kinase [Clostridia bacterium]|nr:adenylate kinase [Clostridia bacterium]